MRNEVNRREIALAAMACGCLAGLPAPALAQIREAARVGGKPLLTQAALMRAIPRPGDPQFSDVLNEAGNNLSAFLNARFTLTPEQQQFVNSLSPSDRAALQQALSNAALRGEAVDVSFTPPSKASGSCPFVGVHWGQNAVTLQPMEQAQRGQPISRPENSTQTPGQIAQPGH